ncbi:TetR/AcrR family transcriptional regulator [Thauera sp. SDU_THAU2]|uniref:TetR/AcrR family transcriptional regulator n=1 Tax=Thauera sp. SDU_THAU2 TaxID=3136633 RepID=UPI00311EBAAF
MNAKESAVVPGKKAAINHRTVVGRNRRSRTKARIIEAALQVFAEKGPDAPVIDDFIKITGIARGTFYNYFSSTAELLSATATWLADDLADAIESSIQIIDDPLLRHGMGMRLWMEKAKADKAWCSFVASVWFQGGSRWMARSGTSGWESSRAGSPARRRSAAGT